MEYICDKETFLRVRKAQIEMITERRLGAIAKEYRAAADAWWAGKPAEELSHNSITCPTCFFKHSEPNPKYEEYKKAYEVWRNAKPSDPTGAYDAIHARHLNIFYSILKGKKYSQVEQKVRKGNEFSLYALEKLCKAYNIDFEAFKAKM